MTNKIPVYEIDGYKFCTINDVAKIKARKYKNRTGLKELVLLSEITSIFFCTNDAFDSAGRFLPLKEGGIAPVESHTIYEATFLSVVETTRPKLIISCVFFLLFVFPVSLLFASLLPKPHQKGFNEIIEHLLSIAPKLIFLSGTLSIIICAIYYIFIWALDKKIFLPSVVKIAGLNYAKFVDENKNPLPFYVTGSARNFLIYLEDAKLYLADCGITDNDFIPATTDKTQDNQSETHVKTTDNKPSYLDRDNEYFAPLLAMSVDIWERMFIHKEGNQSQGVETRVRALIKKHYPSIKDNKQATDTVTFSVMRFVDKSDKLKYLEKNEK